MSPQSAEWFQSQPHSTIPKPVDQDAEAERAAWLAKHSHYCPRLQASITTAQCELNRKRPDYAQGLPDSAESPMRPPACRDCDGGALVPRGQALASLAAKDPGPAAAPDQKRSDWDMDICRACGHPILPKSKRPHGIHPECYKAFRKLPLSIRSRGIAEWIATVEAARIEAEEERTDYTEKEFEAVLNTEDAEVYDTEPKTERTAAIERPAGDVILADGEQFRVLGTGRAVSETPTIGGLSKGMVIHKSAVIAYGLDRYSHVVVGAQGSERIALLFLHEPAPGSRRIGAEKKGMHVALADLVRIFDGRRGPWELKRTNEPGVFVADLS